MSTPSQKQNPNGLHKRFHLERLTKTGRKQPVDQEAEYFVLRLDAGGSDPIHVAACQFAINAYADAIQHHLPDLANDIRGRYPISVAVADEPKTGRPTLSRETQDILMSATMEIEQLRNHNSNMSTRLQVYDDMVSVARGGRDLPPRSPSDFAMVAGSDIVWRIKQYVNSNGTYDPASNMGSCRESIR